MTKLDVTAVVTDSDVFWLNDPKEYFNRYMDADVLMAGENNIPTFEDDGLEYLPQVEYGINIGVMVVRPKAKGLMESWLHKTKNESSWD